MARSVLVGNWDRSEGKVGLWLQVDTMIVQAIGLLDDLDKELNTYAMRVREWYGWHFPEMTRIVADNVTYAKAVSDTAAKKKGGHAVLCEWMKIRVSMGSPA